MFVQVVLVFSFWQGRNVVLNCDKGSDSMHDYRFGVGIFMKFELKQKVTWFFLVTGVARLGSC